MVAQYQTTSRHVASEAGARLVAHGIEGRTAAQISTSVEEGIRVGRLASGATLPPVRVLAAALGISPATVVGAYRALRDRGLVETAGRAGTRVRQRPPVAGRQSRRPPVPEGVLDLSSGGPGRHLLPDLGPSMVRAAAVGGPWGYECAGPLPALLDLARERLAGAGVPLGQSALTVVSGALDGIERALCAHLRPGDRVAVEDPGWANLFDLVAALGFVPEPVPVDACGPTEAGLVAALATGIRAFVVTCRAQNPTGAAITADRAEGLRRLLSRHPETLVVEDDHEAELATGAPHHLVGSGGPWAFVRSVSKPYGPDLRLAVLAGDEVTVSRVEGRMLLGAGWVSTVLQRLVVDLWTDPLIATGVAAAGSRYAEVRHGLVALLLDRGVTAHGTSGINVWVPVEDETVVVARLRDRGYAVAPGAMFRIASPPGVRITVSDLGDEALAPLAEAVARAVDPSRGPGQMSA